MVYADVCEAFFIERLNRFVARVELDGRAELCHVKNTGRCRELFIPGARCHVQRFAPGQRKTALDLIAVWKGERLVNVDSQAPNRVFREWVEGGGLLPGPARVRPEYTYRNSRFDFLIESGGQRALVEVKGVTLEEDGVALFPDAPTERGVKHLRELAACREDGFDAHVVFVIQMEGVNFFSPNARTHPAFAEALRAAQAAGVYVHAFDCAVTPDSLTIKSAVEVRL
jgi:sugar fermentation stimulation protein A